MTLWTIGAALGLIVAQWAIDGLLQLAPAALPRREHIGIDTGIASFAIGVSLVSALISGLVPAWYATKEDLTGTLKQDPSSSLARPPHEDCSSPRRSRCRSFCWSALD